MENNNLTTHVRRRLLLIVLLTLSMHVVTARAERPGWNEPGREPGFDKQGLLRINLDYFRLSANTGGDFYFWAPGEFATAAGTLAVPITSAPIALASAVGSTPFSQRVDIPVDATLSRLTLFAGAQRLEELALLRPDGRTIADNPANVTVQTFRHMRIVTVLDPEPGVWRATLSGNGSYMLNARYLSERNQLAARGLKGIDLIDTEYVELKGRPGHQGLFAIDRNQPAGTTPLCRISVSGAIEQPVVELVSASDAVLARMTLENHLDAADDELFGRSRIPDQPYRVRIRGYDELGNPVQRLGAGMFTPGDSR